MKPALVILLAATLIHAASPRTAATIAPESTRTSRSRRPRTSRQRARCGVRSVRTDDAQPATDEPRAAMGDYLRFNAAIGSVLSESPS